MHRILRTVVLVLGGAILWAAPTSALARFETMDLAAVPAEARKAAEAGAPGVRFGKAAREVTRAGTPGETVRYKLTGRDGQGHVVGVHVGSDNRLYGVDREIVMAGVSKAATASLKARRKELPRGFKLSRVVERTTYGIPVVFIFEGKNVKGEAVQIMISPDGKQLQIAGQDD